MKKTKTAKGVTEKLLANVSEEHVFFCADGQIFRNTEELSNGLNHMSDETFFYHSNCDKHDFSNWLKDVVGDEKLATDMLGVGNRTEAAMIIRARIRSLQSK